LIRSRRRLIAAGVLVLVIVVLVASGRGGNKGRSGSGATQPSVGGATTTSSLPAKPATGTVSEYTAAIAETMRADPAFASIPARDAQCAAKGVVDAVGLDTLHRLGLSPARIRAQKQLPPFAGNLNDAQANALTDALLRCIDFGRVIATQIEINTSRKVTDAQVQCINAKVENNPAARKGIAAAYTGATKGRVDILGLASECFTLTTPTT
jgi:hypothetical protein